MIDILEKIDNTKAPLSEILSFADSALVDECIELIKSRYILNILDKDNICEDDIRLISNIVKCQGKTEIDSDLRVLVSKMITKARERSKGYAPVGRIFVKNSTYGRFCSQNALDNDIKIKILGISLEPIECPKDIEYDVFCICRPKTTLVPINILTLVGKLNN